MKNNKNKNKKTGAAKKAIKTKAKSRFGLRSIVLPAGAEQTTLKYKTKEAVFLQGDPPAAIFYLQKGRIKIAIVSKQGKEAIVAIHQAGEFFGECCLAGQTLHMASAIAIEESIVVRIGKENMIRLLHEHPAFAGKFMAFLLSRNIQVVADLADQLFNSSEKRLARRLLLLANFSTEGVIEKAIPKIGQDVLAARVGTTRSRISYFMNKFRRLGFIEYNGGLKVRAALVNVIRSD